MHVSAASIIAVPLAGMSSGPVMTIQHAMLYTSMHLLSHVRSEMRVRGQHGTTIWDAGQNVVGVKK